MCFFPQRTGRQRLCQLGLEEEHLRALDLKKKVEEEKREREGKEKAKEAYGASDLLLREASGAILSHFVII